MPIIYVTVENQLRSDGSYGLLYDHFTNLNQAYAKLYTILAAAAVSGIPYHAGHLIAYDHDNARLIAGMAFDNRVEPEPEEEPNE